MGGSSNAPEARKKAVAKRKSVPQSHQTAGSNSGGSGTKKAISDDEDGHHGGDGIDIKRIKAEPEPSGSGAQSSAMEDIGDDSYAGEEGADDFGDGEDFEGFAQYGEGQDFDDSLAGASGSGAGADGKDLNYVEEVKGYTVSQFGRALLVDQRNYTYSCERKRANRTFWACTNSWKKCKGRATTYENYIMSLGGIHNHEANPNVVNKMLNSEIDPLNKD